MDTLLWLGALAAVLVGVAGMVLPLLPGAPLLFGGLWLAAWLDGYARVGTGVLVALAVLALLAMAVDAVAAALGVKRAGASRLAMAGAGLGALLGLLAGPFGLVLGPVVGAVGGEWLARRDLRQAGRAGAAAGLAFIAAVAVKLGLAVAMLGLFGAAWWW